MFKFLALIVAVVIIGLQAHSEPSLEDYASLPDTRSLQMSPSGNRIAAITRVGSDEFLCVFELKDGTSDCYINVTDMKPRRVIFAGEDTVILVVSKTTRTLGYRGKFDFSAAFSVSLKDKKVKQLLKNAKGLHPAQTGLGRVLSVSADGSRVYMPAYVGRGDVASYELFETRTDRTTAKAVGRGTTNTVDWFVTPDGTELAREDFDDRDDEHQIRSRVTGKWETIYSNETEIPEISVIGLTSDHKNLVIVDGAEDSDYNALYTMDLVTGEISEPLFHKDGSEIDGVLVDTNRVAYGVIYSGLTPSYGFFDKELNAEIEKVVSSFDMNSVRIDSWSSDWTQILSSISGSNFSGRYIIYDRTDGSYNAIADSRQNITTEYVAPMMTVEFQARDGLKIPAVITWPVETTDETQKNLPFIVMPHGGPESYDQIGFDWMAQYFASQGYGVIQPNFRGSSGFGREFTMAGRGEWGKAMQNDVTDGLDAIVNMGWADSDRVCIVGWSYGGYAALAGGAFTPDKFKCVVSVAGVSDLPQMLIDERRDHGSDHWVYSYWSDQIGNLKEARNDLEAVSPKYHADKFNAPVLLIHGRDDLTVPVLQSSRMEDALKDAGKPVKFIMMKDQDHSLSTQNARVEAMKEIIAFVDKNIGE